jgi:hypothetical protein
VRRCPDGDAGEVCSSCTLSLVRKLLVSIGIASVLTLMVSAGASAAQVRDCGTGEFPDAITARGTSCAVAKRVEKGFTKACRRFLGGAPDLTSCTPTVVGFKCRPTGDYYHPIICTKGREQVTFRIAE